jgi:hypothetical protein
MNSTLEFWEVKYKMLEYVNTVFKIKHELYVASRSAPLPLNEKLCVRACTEMQISVDTISTDA